MKIFGVSGAGGAFGWALPLVSPLPMPGLVCFGQLPLSGAPGEKDPGGVMNMDPGLCLLSVSASSLLYLWIHKELTWRPKHVETNLQIRSDIGKSSLENICRLPLWLNWSNEQWSHAYHEVGKLLIYKITVVQVYIMT